MSKFLTDDNVLRVSAAALAVDAVVAGAFPDRFHDRYMDTNTQRSVPHTRWVGLLLGAFAAQTLAPTLGSDAKAKKNALKVLAATATTAGVRNVMLIRSKHQKQSTTGGIVAAQAVLASAALYQAFKK